MNFKNKKKWEIAIAKKLLSSREEKSQKIQFEDEKFIMSHIIKYLHFYARFVFTKYTKNEFNIDQKSIKSKKSTNNSKILKIYVDIIKKIAFNKMWLKLNRVYRKIANIFCFLQILNKKKFLKIDWTKSKTLNHAIKHQDYHFTNIFESRIDQKHIFFIIDMMNKKQRDATTLKIMQRHINWKIQAHTTYKTKCKQYVFDRKRWKFQLLQKIQDNFEMKWFIDISIDEIIKLTNFRHDKKFKN